MKLKEIEKLTAAANLKPNRSFLPRSAMSLFFLYFFFRVYVLCVCVFASLFRLID